MYNPSVITIWVMRSTNEVKADMEKMGQSYDQVTLSTTHFMMLHEI